MKYRHFTTKDAATLRKLWPSRITDDAIAKRLGRTRWSMREFADRIGLPSRKIARASAEQERGLQ